MNQNKTEKRDSMVFYRTFYEALMLLELEERDMLMRAILEYGFDGKTVELNSNSGAKIAFSFAKKLIDSANERYRKNSENGKKGGAPKGNTNARKKNTATEQETEQPNFTGNNGEQPKTTDENNPIQANPQCFSSQNNKIQPNSTENSKEQPNTQENNLYDNVYEYDNVNESDNEYEYEFVTDSESDTVTESDGDTKRPYGLYKNVFLTENQARTLTQFFGKENFSSAVEYLSNFQHLVPTYKEDAYSALKGWVMTAIDRKKSSPKTGEQFS